MPFSIKTLGTLTLGFDELSINNCQHNAMQSTAFSCYSERHNTESDIFIVLLSVVMPNVIVASVVVPCKLNLFQNNLLKF